MRQLQQASLDQIMNKKLGEEDISFLRGRYKVLEEIMTYVETIYKEVEACQK